MKGDAQLQQDIMNELKWDPSVKAAIRVDVKDGVVRLSGYVDSYSKKWAADLAAARVFGVKAVESEEIQVRLPNSLKRPDENIARAASNALEWDVSVPHDRVKVQVQNGLVTLSGEVDWWYQKNAAETAVRHLMGVVSVSNGITIKPESELLDADIKDKIESAFQRNAVLDARRITIETRGSKVILRGSVHSRLEKEQVQWAVWAAPGVSEVESHITINP
jgi:osmotically-inducible protein OsmY